MGLVHAGDGDAAASGCLGPQALDLDLRLEVPAADAQSIEELEGEVVMATASQWRDLCATNVCPGSSARPPLAFAPQGRSATMRNRFTSAQAAV